MTGVLNTRIAFNLGTRASFRVLILASVFGALCSFFVLDVSAQSSEQQIKAAFLYHFCSYVQWPNISTVNGTATIVIGIAGSRRSLGYFERTLAGVHKNRFNLIVRPVAPSDNLESINILYVTNDSGFFLKDFQKLTAKSPILTVTEEATIPDGSMINFVLREDKVRFEASNSRATAASLKLSSQLLAIAVQVHWGSSGKTITKTKISSCGSIYYRYRVDGRLRRNGRI